MKSDHKKKAGLLQPIPMLERKWQYITTDLVTNLPESEGMIAIDAFVDQLTKMVHFVHYKKEITAQQYAQLFIDHDSSFMASPKQSFLTTIHGS